MNKYNELAGLNIYEDEYMEDGKILIGRKETERKFVVANPKTCKLIKKILLKKERRIKLLKIIENKV